MANGTLDLNKVIADLLTSAGKAVAKSPSPVATSARLSQTNLLQALANISPTAIGGALTSGSKDNQPALPPDEIEPGEDEKIVQGLIKKQKTDQAKQALQQAPAGKVLESAKFMDQQSEQKKLGQVLGQVGRFILDPGSNRPGEFRQPSALGGLIRPSTTDAVRFQALAGEAPLQRGEREKILLQGQVDIAKEQLKEATELAKAGRLKPNDLFTKFENAIKPFQLQRDAFGRIQASASDPSPAGDLALIFNFMKVLDPGSTVREGEFATAQNSAGVPERIRNTANRVLRGERLGTAQRADSLILEQLSTQPDFIKMEAEIIIESLYNGMLVSNISNELFALFRPSVQPYLISWFAYDPKIEISEVTTSVIILHGTTDLQVQSSQAILLAQHNSNAVLVIIDNMNHVLKDASINQQENFATYSNPDLTLSVKFSESITDFIEEVKMK